MADAHSRFLVGLALSVLNGLLSSVGFILQRKAQLLSEPCQCIEVWQVRLIWAVGIALYILAAVPDAFAYALVPQLVCTTVACGRLVLVTILAHSFLEEQVQRRAVIGIFLCSIGTAVCLVYGPRSADIEVAMLEDGPYHAQLWMYFGVGLALLVTLLSVDHAAWTKARHGLHYAVLPLATGLAFALEKVLNTELGYLRAPRSPQEALQAPLWCGMVASIGVLGLTDFYLSVRGAATMPVQFFVPASFAFGTALQFFQSVVIFDEFAAMTPARAALSSSGAILALIGALLIQPPSLEALWVKDFGVQDVELASFVAEAGRQLNSLSDCAGDCQQDDDE
mmetsp:Transcript_68153/g.197559  ORF Transcript_68153/g.197559 Transcript_68153/m.197559 type:complete len:338 (-) Transcript_68153:278-1291(-)